MFIDPVTLRVGGCGRWPQLPSEPQQSLKNRKRRQEDGAGRNDGRMRAEVETRRETDSDTDARDNEKEIYPEK